MASKAAAVNFHKILSSGIGKETGAQLAAFRKRSEEARRALNQLKAQPVTVDFAAYKGVLKVRGSTCAWHDGRRDGQEGQVDRAWLPREVWQPGRYVNEYPRAFPRVM